MVLWITSAASPLAVDKGDFSDLGGEAHLILVTTNFLVAGPLPKFTDKLTWISNGEESHIEIIPRCSSK